MPPVSCSHSRSVAPGTIRLTTPKPPIGTSARKFKLSGTRDCSVAGVSIERGDFTTQPSKSYKRTLGKLVISQDFCEVVDLGEIALRPYDAHAIGVSRPRTQGSKHADDRVIRQPAQS